MKCIDEIPRGELRGKRIFVRSDFNLPLGASGEVSDLFRLKRGWQTIEYLSKAGARVIVASHMGRDPEATLEPVARAMKRLGSVVYVPDLTGHLAQDAVRAMKDGDILLLENLRRDAREKSNDAAFSKELAALADIYVGDAFAAAHRSHASIVGVAKLLPHYAGFLMRDEVENLSAARTPESPSFAMLGGAKFETKVPLIRSLLAAYDHLFIVGALANDIFAARGFSVGRSLISKE
ncbi:MAG: phosphoglycerate kinase, partial [Patescibacteria group bacterium]|nr:phosphoglycerate kinase [Patescibacteria group bacterium]